MMARDMLNEALKNRGLTQAQGAALIGWSAQKLSQRLIRKSLRADDFIMIMDALGYEIDFRDKKNPEASNEDGKSLKEKVAEKERKRGYGRPVIGMSDRIAYDTENAEALSNTFYEDGENEYDEDGRATELYVDREGRYFLAEYSNKEGERDRVKAVPACVAVAFIEKYGTDLKKDRKNSE